MTRISWDRLSGEEVEEFVAALVLKRHGSGHLITPAQGDRGIDIRVPTADGFDIWQVKRYTSALTSAQKRSVSKSWTSFVRETLPHLPVTAWKLAMPFNPTNEALEWFDTFTADGLHTAWVGRTLLDAWAAEEPALVDYYFGNGREETVRLMGRALDGAESLPDGASGEQLLSAVTARVVGLRESLDEVDPFYRYEIEVVHGTATDAVLERDLDLHPGAAMATYEQFAPDQYTVTRVFPRFEGAMQLRPIRKKFTLVPEVGSEDQQAIENFLAFGTPFEGIRGVVTDSEGPAGTTHVGQAQFSFMAAKSNAFGIPALEVRVIGKARNVVSAIPVENVRRSSGVTSTGEWIAFGDPQGVFDIELQFGAPGKQASMTTTMSAATGKRPADVLPAVRTVASFVDGHSLVLGVRDGGPPIISDPWPLATDELQDILANVIPFLEALAEIQRHTLVQILVPDLETLLPGQRSEILRTARLLRGETVEFDWESHAFTVSEPRGLTSLDAGEFQLLMQDTLVVHIADQVIPTDMVLRTHLPAVRVDGPTAPKDMAIGQKFNVKPVKKRAAILTAHLPAETADEEDRA